MPGTIPKLMNAVWYEANGDAADVFVHGEMPVPQPAAGEVLVRLGASGVNPSDVKARAGSRPMGFDRVIPHSDGAGTVERGAVARAVAQRGRLDGAAEPRRDAAPRRGVVGEACVQ